MLSFPRLFHDTDLGSIRKSIFSFSAIYGFFFFYEGFQLKGGDFFEPLSKEPMTFSSAQAFPVLAIVLLDLTVRLIFSAAEKWRNRIEPDVGKNQGILELSRGFEGTADRCISALSQVSTESEKLRTQLPGDHFPIFENAPINISDELRAAIKREFEKQDNNVEITESTQSIKI